MLLVPPPLACCLAFTNSAIAFLTGPLSKRADSLAMQRCNAGCRLRQALPGEGKSPFQERQAAVPGEILIPRLSALRVLGGSKGEARTCRMRPPRLGAAQGLSLVQMEQRRLKSNVSKSRWGEA